ncbi:MAG TPA: hypothetical protein VGR44_08655 [Methylomirabilota bacterium]|jgi:hypothetical protein|nr:hypothetical protein [Methylomirabilota bacterium]
MDSLTLKLVLTPALIGGASLAGRRWGPGVSGWLVGLPLTSAPVAVFLALEQGAAFAASAAVGTMEGAISQAAFCLAYGWLAFRGGRLPAMGASVLAFALATALLQRVALPLPARFIIVLAALAAALWLMPAGRPSITAASASLPAWDIPARMVVATVFVLLLTGAASKLGPRLTGLLAPFPLYAAILAVFAHHLEGPAAAASVLKGLLLGLFGFAGFFLVFAALIESAGILAAVAAATAVTLVFQAASLWALRRSEAARYGR